ncbi:MAG: hypothetical protein ACYCU0_08475 [Solirubrobacteraceae bacterium]
MPGKSVAHTPRPYAARGGVSPEGTVVYSNRYVIWSQLAWGRLRDYEVYEGTQRLPALDAYLDARTGAVA